MKTLSMFSVTLLCSSAFYSLFLLYLNSSMTRFSSEILLVFPDSNDLNSRCLAGDVVTCFHFENKQNTQTSKWKYPSPPAQRNSI